MTTRSFNQFFRTPHNYPILLDCNFIVDPSNANGLGISGLVGPGISNVYMHTSQTPDPNNPNPSVGVILVQFQQPYFRLFNVLSSFGGPGTGTDIVITAAGAHIVQATLYKITVVGTSTLADWQAIGLPVGITPTVGATFLGSATTGSGTGTGKVQVVNTAVAGIDHIEVFGSPNLGLVPVGVGPTVTLPYLLLNTCLANAVATPTALSQIFLQFYLTTSGNPNSTTA